MWLYVPPTTSASSPSAPASAASTLASDSPWEGDAELWATSSGKPTRRPSSWRGWKKRPWIRHLSGTISRPSTAARGAAEWISSLEATPASPSRWQALVEASRTSGICGPTSDESSPKSSRSRSSSRTSQATYLLASRTSFATWKAWATAWRQVSSRRRKSVPRTEGSASSFWPTVRASDGRKGSGESARREGGPSLVTASKQWPTPSATSYGTNQGGAAGRTGPVRGSLETLAKNWPEDRGSAESQAGNNPARPAIPPPPASNWPTPTSGDAKASGASGYSTESGRHTGTTLTDAAVGPRGTWATPAARDWSSENPNQSPEHSPTLGRQVLRTSTDGEPFLRGSTRRLNVCFVEWLQGLPIGWTHIG